jgi:ABC-type transport system involved in cytochrome c biogenesis permease component
MVRGPGHRLLRWFSVLKLLIGKELAIELRGKECIALLLCTILVVGALIGAGVSSAVLDAATTTKIYPMLVWVVFLITTTTASARASESELEGRGFEGLFLAGVSGAQLYLAKVVVTTGLFLVTWVLLITVASAALDQNILPVFGKLVAIGAAASLTLSALIVLVAGMAGTSKLRGVLLPLLTLPLLFPLFFAGVELTMECMLYGAITPGSIWPGIILVSGAAFLLVGINAYEVAVKG